MNSAKIIFKDREHTVKPGITIRKALKELNIPSQGVIATRNNDLITEDEIIRQGDVIILIPAISGG